MRTWTMVAMAGLICCGRGPTAGASDRAWTFEGDAPGSIANGFTAASGAWRVVATDEGRALAQVAESADPAFNVALVEGTNEGDVDLSVRIKVVAGVNDQGGGLVWRARDAKNYYIARYNHLEDNFRVYKVVDGVRSPPLRDAIAKHHDGWTTVRVTMKGDRIACSLDGRTLLEATDATFPRPGMIGIWSKSDARTLFDDLTLGR